MDDVKERKGEEDRKKGWTAKKEKKCLKLSNIPKILSPNQCKPHPTIFYKQKMQLKIVKN